MQKSFYIFFVIPFLTNLRLKINIKQLNEGDDKSSDETEERSESEEKKEIDINEVKKDQPPIEVNIGNKKRKKKKKKGNKKEQQDTSTSVYILDCFILVWLTL